MDTIVTEVVSIITAVGVLLTGLGTLRINHKANVNHDATADLRTQLHTVNGHTVGELIEQNLPPSTGDQVATLEPRGDQNTRGAPEVATTKPDSPPLTR